jgi:hypothetical protein
VVVKVPGTAMCRSGRQTFPAMVQSISDVIGQVVSESDLRPKIQELEIHTVRISIIRSSYVGGAARFLIAFVVSDTMRGWERKNRPTCYSERGPKFSSVRGR